MKIFHKVDTSKFPKCASYSTTILKMIMVYQIQGKYIKNVYHDITYINYGFSLIIIVLNAKNLTSFDSKDKY